MPRHRHIKVPCPDCRDPVSGRPRGLLWLGGKDYMTCATCDGLLFIPMVEEPKPVPGKIFLPHAPRSLILSQRVD